MKEKKEKQYIDIDEIYKNTCHRRVYLIFVTLRATYYTYIYINILQKK